MHLSHHDTALLLDTTVVMNSLSDSGRQDELLERAKVEVSTIVGACESQYGYINLNTLIAIRGYYTLLIHCDAAFAMNEVVFR